MQVTWDFGNKIIVIQEDIKSVRIEIENLNDRLQQKIEQNKNEDICNFLSERIKKLEINCIEKSENT